MAREGLASALRQAIQRAAKSGGPARAEGLRVKVNGGIREVSIEVIPLARTEEETSRHHLILFFEARARQTEPASPRAAREREPRPKAVSERRVAELTRELADARQSLRATYEEHEAAMEGLRAAAEEAQSSNEELQSTNEELETTKEELQATNEELSTVNDELKSRNDELDQLGNDLSNLLTSTHVPIIMVGIDLRIRRMTPITERVLNLAPTDIGRPIGDLKLSAEVPDLEALLRGTIETLTIQEREIEARDGHWYAVRVRPYRTVDNKIDGAVISFVDIDSLKRGLAQTKEAREQAEAIVATVREPLVILDPALRVMTANRSFYATFQVTKEDTERRLLFDLGNGQWDTAQLRRLLEEILPRDNTIEDFEVEHDFETIGRRTMRLNARRVLTTNGAPSMILLAIEDVTEMKRLEAERAAFVECEQALRARAETATMAKDRFLAVLSHELRTPLTAMVGWIRLLKSQKLDPAGAARALEVIERNTLLQGRLIEDLLDVSRSVSGTLDVELRPVNVTPSVEAALTMMRPAAVAKGVRLESKLDVSVGPVRADPTRLQQIVWNLVSNAIKFTPSGGRVDVGLARRGSNVEIIVRDTGKGIAAEQLPHIFGRFGTANPNTRTRSEGGLGLGLTIVRHLVERHGGTVQADSAGSGQGTTFTVSIPLTDERPTAEAEPSEIKGLAECTGIRVLVVDDDADARELISTILAASGVEVTVAATAEQALSALDRETFDVLVSDIALPEDDRYELIRKVRARDVGRGGQIPALALSAYAGIEDRAEAIAAGYQQHATKPIQPADLVAAVVTLAGRAERPRPS
jgi:two-component system CheB/CheR fusion protein